MKRNIKGLSASFIHFITNPNKSGGSPRRLTIEKWRSQVDLPTPPFIGHQHIQHTWSNVYKKSWFRKAQGERSLSHRFDVIYYVDPLQYCRWITVEPMPCKGLFYQHFVTILQFETVSASILSPSSCSSQGFLLRLPPKDSSWCQIIPTSC